MNMTDTFIDRPDLVEIGDAFDSLQADPVLVEIAKTNLIEQTSWDSLKKTIQKTLTEQHQLMAHKIPNDQTKQHIDKLCLDIDHILQDQSHCPFTIQRVCELVIHPACYYKMYIKYLRAVQKVISIRSSYEDYSYRPPAETMEEDEDEEEEEEEEEDEEEDMLDDIFENLKAVKVEESRTDLTDFSKHKVVMSAPDEDEIMETH
ncbi:PPP4R2-domain-containing protein [Choanephora cucurbitarum]|nr:PPP4R2-domain-containing protein [Choanephora cucurbitarum]